MQIIVERVVGQATSEIAKIHHVVTAITVSLRSKILNERKNAMLVFNEDGTFIDEQGSCPENPEMTDTLNENFKVHINMQTTYSSLHSGLRSHMGVWAVWLWDERLAFFRCRKSEAEGLEKNRFQSGILQGHRHSFS